MKGAQPRSKLQPFATKRSHKHASRCVSDSPDVPGDDLQIAINFISHEHESLTHSHRTAFQQEISRDLVRLFAWCLSNEGDSDGPRSLTIDVSHDFKISKSLVPAWFGQRGYMEFPAWRVIAGEAAIIHELVHVYFPNANRFLAEGLAVALQAALGKSPAFPNFGRPLHSVARECLVELIPGILAGGTDWSSAVHLDDLNCIATPEPLTLMVGEEFLGEDPASQGVLYLIAGSFVKFLIDFYGAAQFRMLYALTPFAPLQQNAGPSTRWTQVYDKSLAELCHAWGVMIAALPNTRQPSRRANPERGSGTLIGKRQRNLAGATVTR